MSTAANRRSALTDAAREALTAPSIFNTQPWIWRTVDDSLQLWADRDRQLVATDPDGRQLIISCGSALHHARTALAAASLEVAVHRFPDATQPDLLAAMTVSGVRPGADAARQLAAAIRHRHSDRRAFTAQPVPTRLLSELVAAAEGQGAHAHVLSTGQVALLRAAVEQAASAHQADADYRAELLEWTSRNADTADGVPASAAVATTARRVPVRDFATIREGVSAGPEHDMGAEYLLIFTDDDRRADWLRAGEALSAVLLTCTAAGLASSPGSDVIEVEQARQHLGRVLEGGGGHPQSVVRIGYAPDGEPAASPRRDEGEVINP